MIADKVHCKRSMIHAEDLELAQYEIQNFKQKKLVIGNINLVTMYRIEWSEEMQDALRAWSHRSSGRSKNEDIGSRINLVEIRVTGPTVKDWV